MKVAVLGSGLMGKEAARDLVHSSGVEQVGLADIDLDRANRVCQSLNARKIKGYKVDAGNPSELADFIKQYDVVINALFYSFNEVVAKTAIDVGVHSVDLGGHIGHITDKVLELDKQAKDAGVTVIPDLGVAPGMINILSGYGTGKLDQVESIRLFVGGIPVRPDPPLEYNHVFSMEGLLDHYSDPSTIIRDGKLREVESLTEVEQIYFDRFGPLEAFHTSGGTSTLLKSYPDIDTLEYKTIRYPGHAKKMKLLVDLNLTGADKVVEMGGVKIKTRDVLLKSIDPLLELKDKDDAVLLRVIVGGKKAGAPKTYEYEMATYKDRATNVTAMARATANTISVVAQMIGAGKITKRGVCPPETIVPGDLYIDEMMSRGVVIKEQS
ncbi:lysine 6-dehydrogenase [Halobacillus karajensis]|uniref:Lysine 6-dehydrogenase n=2 Tax=Halobacillus karajensis TaxID=195088 RepID=A0A024P5R6_9BACI|nr:saccharopine dehydrogenase C-terminal domain-containing protein [Halobacillus karajensis]CDQ17789.1 Lysine 6-dehydrogenase [Halobacillus karajensis]CDQ24195.1 Lysine 6-dehydrogenase [Halobacillus karajensis]CDQ29556.1 Lysine 6-dehydrogenase [Halobacillus karajensis]SEH63824.1 lysine 6-dehydrogenase [Halobacillus karajensis]